MRFGLDSEKAVNAIAYFSTKCPGATKMKVCKLLYFSDKEHLLQYGRPITGDTYVRMPWGPTPSAGLNMMRGRAPSRLTALFQEKITVQGNVVRVLSSPDLRVFSRSDLRIMQQVFEKYGRLTAAELSRLSHREPTWQKTGENQLIDFELFFAGRPDAELTLELLREDRRAERPAHATGAKA